MLITLSDEQEDFAEDRARERQAESEKRHNSNRYGARKNLTTEEDLQLHLAGCRGEIAAGWAYGVESHLHVNVYHSVPDIGDIGEVRCRSKSYYDLLIRDDDADDRYYILVIGNHLRGSQLNVVGGIFGKLAKQDEWRKDHGGYGTAWFVPQKSLDPPERIPKGWV